LVQIRKRPARPPDYLTIKEAIDIAGTIGHPSKMPGYTYGISAQKCHTGSQLRSVPGSVCSSCYACTDWYRSWQPLLDGHARRFAGLTHPRWVDALVRLISGKCTGEDEYFRWHDSGDLQGVWHLKNIVAVCERTPNVKHWLPTREYDYVARFLAEGNEIPPNLCIRLSAHMIDQEPVIPERLRELIGQLPVSTVSTAPYSAMGIQVVEGKGSIECRAVEARDNKCGNCRACWDRRVRSVNYPQH
jgi:hypothetical protein